eukprot:TRINITY_DN3896_c1_g4_i3.p1 TRINITY_DN3896_c1_g4~~TRINITY_DN3896_c1_g4_i3.p1  ORF type:complete len:149 (-),score=12.70 TRINITY_DN3896_c1_g4_i3:88-534(-)
MASFGATYWPRGEGSWRSQVSSVQSENLESVLGSCPSFNDFSMHTHDDFSKEYQMNDLRRSSVQISREQKQTADLRRSSVPAVLRTYSSVDVLPEQQDDKSSGGMRSFVSMPLSSFRGFSATSKTDPQHKIDGLDYYDFVDLVRGCPT